MIRPTARPTGEPIFSILIPSFNSGGYLEAALTSVLDQEVVGEVLVQDAGSGPDTRRVLDLFSSRVDVQIEPDRGQADALNKAFARCAGDIIGWLNADDIYYPGVLEKVAATFRLNPGVDVVYGDFALVDAEGRQLRRYFVGPWDRHRLYKRGCYIFSGATFFRRSVFTHYGGFRQDLHYCMDLEFFLRIADSVTAVHLPIVIGALRIHSASKSVGSGWRFLPEGYRVRKEVGHQPGARLLALSAGARAGLYLALQPLRYSRGWASLRSSRRL